MTDLTLLGIDWQLAHATRQDVREGLTRRRIDYLASLEKEQSMNAHAQPPQDAAPDTAQRIAQFIQLRNKIKEIEDRHEQELAPYKQAKQMLENDLLARVTATGGDSIAARGVGTVYRSTKSTASIADRSEFQRFVIGGELWELLDWKANATAVEEFLNSNLQLPPGVNFSQKVTVGVRKA